MVCHLDVVHSAYSVLILPLVGKSSQSLRRLYSSSASVITPSTMPARFNNELIKQLQSAVAPQIFTPRAVYDGRKNMFATRRLPLAGSDSQEVGRIFSFHTGNQRARQFDVSLPRRGGPDQSDRSSRPPKIFKIKLTKVAEINPE